MAECLDPHFGTTETSGGLYDLVTAFEVFEHAIDPVGTAEQAMSHVAEGGVLLFSTLLQPRTDLAAWYYVAPRNGHVSIHTRASLGALAHRLGARYRPLGSGLHVFHKGRVGPPSRAILGALLANLSYGHSLGGLPRYRELMAMQLSLGHYRAALAPKHFARALAVSLGLLAGRPNGKD